VELVARNQVLRAVADGQPHLAGGDQRVHRERMRVLRHYLVRRPHALGDLIEAFGQTYGLEIAHGLLTW